jgi:hypothetical protein
MNQIAPDELLLRMMMKTLLVLLALGFFTPLAQAQEHAPLAVATAGVAPKQEIEHAPTVAQCQADQRLWLSKLEDNPPHGIDDVTYGTLIAWMREMSQCMEVDPSNRHGYFNTIAEAEGGKRWRLEDFLKRHNLWEQFKQEDAEGKR